MEAWRPLRASHYGPRFEQSIHTLGFEYEDWDRIAPLIDDVLCGVSRERLDAEYPVRVGNLRLYLTPAMRGLPALRVAFELVEDGQICYAEASLREQEDSL